MNPVHWSSDIKNCFERPCKWLDRCLLLLPSCFSRVRLCAIPQTAAHQAPLSLGFSRTLEWVAISFSNAWKWEVKVKSLSRVRLLATPWTAAYQAPASMGFSRQGYWSGVPLPSPRSSQSTRLSSLCYTAASRYLSVLHMIVHIYQCFFLNLSHPLLLQMCPQICSLCLCLHFFSVNRFISTIFS